MKNTSFLPTYSSGEALRGSDFQSYINILKFIDENSLQFEINTEEKYLHGFNETSGNVYVSLYNGILICSAFGQKVFFSIYDYEKEEEKEFSSYEEALDYLNKE